jgi:hypothetical protein
MEGFIAMTQGSGKLCNIYKESIDVKQYKLVTHLTNPLEV